MAKTAAQLKRGFTPSTKAKLKLLTSRDVDGRTRSAKAVAAFEHQLSLDLAGDLSEAQRCLSRRAAVLNACLQDADSRWAKDGVIDLPLYVVCTNSLRRVLITLGMKRKTKRSTIVELMRENEPE